MTKNNSTNILIYDQYTYVKNILRIKWQKIIRLVYSSSILIWDQYTYVKNILIIKWQKIILYSSEINILMLKIYWELNDKK